MSFFPHTMSYPPAYNQYICSDRYMDDNALTEYYSPILIIWLSMETTRSLLIARGSCATSLQEESPCVKISVETLNCLELWPEPPATRYTYTGHY